MATAKTPPISRRRIRLWLFRLAATVLGPVLFLTLVELILAAVGVGYSSRFVVETTIDGRDYSVPNQKFAWRFFPREIARDPVPFRLAAEKPDNTCRVFVFGGSAALGTPDHTFSFSRVLDVLLSARYPGVRFEVVNTAVTAINSHVVYQIFQDCARLDPDVFVVYLGNNEVVGPFGVGTVFAPLLKSMSVIRTSLALRSLRTGQFVADLASSGTEAARFREWRGLEMFKDKLVAADAPELQTVYDHYRQNLVDICTVARSSGVPVLLSTVAVNLEDCPPFASLHGSELDASKKAEWDAEYATGIAHEEGGRHEEALKAYDAAAAIDDGYAELAFRRARCLRGLGRKDEAREAFVRARELDALRFRADESLNRIVRELTSAAPEVHLLDAESRFSTIAEDGIIGAEVFDDHVHFNFRGNYLLGRVVFDEIEKLLPAWVREKNSDEHSIPDKTVIPDEAACARALGLSRWERVKIGDMVASNFERPPFTEQLGNDDRLARLRSSVRAMRRTLIPANFDAVKAVYREAAVNRPEDPWIPYNHGHFLLTVVGDLEEAERLLAQHLRFWPEDVVARKGFAGLLVRKGRFDKAIAMLEAVLRDYPHDTEALLVRGQAYVGKRDLDGARESFARAVALRPDSSRLRITIAGTWSAAGQSGEALSHYRGALEVDASCTDAYRGLASVSSQLGKPDEAYRYYEKALEVDPDDSATHSNLGNAYLRDDKLDKAVDHYRMALELDPNSILARANLAGALARQDKVREAIAEYEETVRRSPEFDAAHRSLGHLLYQTGQAEGALKHLEEAVRLNPQQPLVILLALAWLHVIPSSSAPADPDRAIEFAKQASALTRGEHPQVLDVLAAALAAKGDFARAIDLAQRAIQLASDRGQSQMAAQIQGHLESYRAGRPVNRGSGRESDR